jgi:integrase
MVKSLETRDLHVAVARRHAALAGFQAVFAGAVSRSTAPVTEAAMIWRHELAKASGDPDSPLSSLLADEAERIEAEHGPAAADGFVEIATGRATPLLHFVDAWLAEGGAKGPLRERTQGQYRSDVAALEAWLRAEGIAPTIEAVTRQAAGRYVTTALSDLDRGTANRKVSAPSSYWRWLVRRGHAEVNPWAGQAFAKGRVGGREVDRKRAFTDAEVSILLAAAADPELADIMQIGALSGMRLDEPYRLRVADCAGGWFDLRRAKTPAGRRRVPIHSSLTEIVARRTKGQPQDAWLFPEPGPERPGRERSMAVSKRFAGHRKRLDVHDTAGGARQSRVTFNSFRSWFVTKARAGFDRAVVAAIVGHEVGNLTDDVYSAGPADEQRRACVESVKLPAPVAS